ncbi:hypothetical protein LIER_40367 [Lithospermum erythrorhizon]|uniref:ATP-dependent DNA helicase n=1 Tax=Lithospermum erythrorhizon TaxID=34254 RepID=A0AAV3QV46_LITER
MLTEFFNINATDPKTRDLKLLYKEFHRYYLWDSQMRTWNKIKKGTVIGRLSIVNPIKNERYYLRVLLNNVQSPTSFDSLLYVNGVYCKSFQKAAHIRRLLQDDNDIDKTMEEAFTYRMPSELRSLFATLLHYCKPSDPPKLFNAYYEHMAKDFRNTQSKLNISEEQIILKFLHGINDTLESLGKNVNEYNLVPFKYVTSDFESFTREIAHERNIPNSEAELIRTSKIIIWDEVTMAEKSVIHALNHLLQELCNNKSLFGGKLVVFGGDFRQVLPVVPRGTGKEQIDASIISSTIWKDIRKLKLTDNMRVKDDPTFIDFLMRIGNGREPTNEKGEIRIPQPMIIINPSPIVFRNDHNKSQGQTLWYVGLYLKQPIFCHGQLYVALSRAKTGKYVKVLIIPPTCHDP